MQKLAYTEFNVTQEKKQKSKRFVDFKNNKKDRLCVDLVALGKANQLINKLTGYSNGQIRYRALWAGVDRNAFRNNIVTPYTSLTIGVERTEQFQESMENYLRKVCPEMWNIIKMKK